MEAWYNNIRDIRIYKENKMFEWDRIIFECLLICE